MPFKKGERHPNQGGARPNAGRKTNRQREQIAALKKAIERKRDAKAEILSDVYVRMAQEDPATMRHVVDRVMAPAKQELELSGGLKIIRINAYRPQDD